MRTGARIVTALLIGVLILLVTAWGAAAISYRAPFGATIVRVLAGLFALVGVLGAIGLFARRLRACTAVFVIALVALLLWWSRIEPRNDRDWQTEVAVLPYADIEGDRVTMHNIRNFAYRTETDFTPQYYDKTFDLRQLDEIDLIASYWMGDAVAHIFLSFGFGGRDYVSISIETRKERSESYSTVAGFFKEYELYYVVADDRDLIRVRTNYRKDPPEDVYMYRVVGPQENARRLFLSYLEEINKLKDHPEFYDTLATNCTTSIWMHTKVNNNRMPFDWKILASGYVPQLLYERGRIDTQLPFDELRRRSRVNDAARAADTDPNFSQRIRASLPVPPSR